MQALNGIHYVKTIGLSFTLRGLTELTRYQRENIEICFRLGRLGDTFEFPDYTEPYEDFPVDAPWPEGTIYELSPALADKQHEDNKARRMWEKLEKGD